MDAPVMFTIMLLTLVVMFGIVMPIANRSRRRRHEERLRALAPVLGAGPPLALTVPWSTKPLPGVELTWGGHRAALVIEPWGRYDLTWVVLRGLSLPRIYARRETSLDRLGKRLGLNREVQTGDLGFDARVYLETDESEALVQRAMGAPAARAAVESLLAGSQPYVRMGPDAVAVRVGFASGTLPTREDIGRALEALSALASSVPAIDAAEIPAPSRRRGDVMATAVAAAFVGSLFAMYTLPIGYVDYRAPLFSNDQGKASTAMFIAWLALVPATWLWVRGHSRSFRNFLTVTLLGVMPLLLLGSEALFLVNALLDRSASVVRDVVVSGTRASSGRYDHRYLYIWRWDAPDRETEMQVSAATFRTLHKGDLMALQTRAGALGWPWAERLTLRRAAPAIAFTARVRSASGPSRVAAGEVCSFTVSRRPTRRGYECQTEVRCGGRWLYGSATRGYFACTFDEGARTVAGSDPSVSRLDRDPAMRVDSRAGTMDIWDDTSRGPWNVAFDIGLAR